jgi:hypothetical protein
MSKLLARLSRLALASNDGADRARRGAYSWRLTAAWSDLLAPIAAESEPLPRARQLSRAAGDGSAPAAPGTR